MTNVFDTKNTIKALFALLIGGAGLAYDKQATLITATAIIVVWALGMLARHFNYEPGKTGLTAALFVISLAMSLFLTPVTLPMFPAWTNDLASYAPLIFQYLASVIEIAAPVISSATLLYNLLLENVMTRLSDYIVT